MPGENGSVYCQHLKYLEMENTHFWLWKCIWHIFCYLNTNIVCIIFVRCKHVYVHPLYKFLILYTYLIPVDDKGAVKMLKEPFTNHHWNSHYTLDHKARKGVIESIRKRWKGRISEESSSPSLCKTPLPRKGVFNILYFAWILIHLWCYLYPLQN